MKQIVATCRSVCRLLIVVFLFYTSSGICKPIEILIPERINFTTDMLDAMKNHFTQTLDCDVTLNIVSEASQSHCLNNASYTFILLEEDKALSSSTIWHQTNIYFDAFWMLEMRTDLPASISANPPKNLSDFQKCLQSLKTADKYKYPWFESLESPITSFHLLQALKSDSTNLEVEFLQKALDDKLLNPLSLEADENLAFEVLQCGDAYFSSMWVPQTLLAENSIASKTIKFIPFPGTNGPSAIHRIRLHLWSSIENFQSVIEKRFSDPSSNWNDIDVINCNIKLERFWIEHESSIFFRRLIAGEL